MVIAGHFQSPFPLAKSIRLAFLLNIELIDIKGLVVRKIF